MARLKGPSPESSILSASCFVAVEGQHIRGKNVSSNRGWKEIRPAFFPTDSRCCLHTSVECGDGRVPSSVIGKEGQAGSCSGSLERF